MSTILCQGVLKQQCINEDGLYEWVRKSFNLLDNCSLEEVSTKTVLLLHGASCAKEWSVSSAIGGGVGFDIVWQSGKIWSFLADDVMSCESWVSNLNSALKKNVMLSKVDETGMNHTLQESTVQSTLNRSSTLDFTQQPRLDAATNSNKSSPNGSTGRDNDTTSVASYGSAAADVRTAVPPHTISQHWGMGIGNTQPINLFGSLPVPPSRIDSETSVRFLNTLKPGDLDMFNQQESQSEPAQRQSQSRDLNQIGSSDMTRMLEEERAEAAVAREQLIRLQHEMDARSQAYDKQLQAAWDSERELVEATRTEIQNQALKRTSDDVSYHEASMRMATEQHHRELACLRDDLTAERKRYAGLLQKEVSSRDRAEAKELELRHDLETLKDSLAHAQADIIRLKEDQRNQANAHSREKMLLATDRDTRLASLTAERDSLKATADGQLRSKIADISSQYDTALKQVETTMAESIRQELLSEKLKEIAKMQKHCTRDIETVRNDERKKSVADIERTRAAFLEREKQTSDDLVELEKVHKKRIARLELQVSEWRDKYEAVTAQYEQLKVRVDKEAEKCQSQHQMNVDKMMELSARSQDLNNFLEQARRDVEEAQAREVTYRSKLASVLNDTRVQRAELQEAQRQMAESHSTASQWHKAALEGRHTHSTTEAQLRIARDEVKMLEHQLSQLRGDNSYLSSAIDKADVLIYGTPQHSSAAAHRLNTGSSQSKPALKGKLSSLHAKSALSSSSVQSSSHDANRSGGSPSPRSVLRQPCTPSTINKSRSSNVSFGGSSTYTHSILKTPRACHS